MDHFDPTQLNTLAKEFHDLAVEVGQTRLDFIAAGAKLDDPDIVSLLSSQFSLLTTSSHVAIDAANFVLDDADQAANAITVATKAADHALNKLKNIDKAVSIASAAVALGTAIYTANLGQIAAAGKTLYDASTASPAQPTSHPDPTA